ncbi:hypothetical protein P4O66_009533 [Electrophorus voltai]|uniref:Uncharacterized protein n=1 Tax=Electrophorus voltai TaxID=2609070 RepID=A0AAD8ZBF2_9TELE|nr:hypothetical protein P4O66_009533 [Electrophorus voltai]
MDSSGSYDPYLDDHRGDTDYGETEECSDICLQSDRGSDCEEEAPTEVEEYPHRDLPSHGDTKSSESKEPPAPKAPPRAHHPERPTLRDRTHPADDPARLLECGRPSLQGAGLRRCSQWKEAMRSGSNTREASTQQRSSGPYPFQYTRYCSPEVLL